MKLSTGAQAALVMTGVCASISATRIARADEVPIDMGKPSTVVLGGAFGANVRKADSIPGYEQSSTSVTTQVLGDVFVGRNVSLGLGIGGSYISTSYKSADTGDYSSHGSALNLALRLGYYVPISNRVGFWPAVSGDITFAKTNGPGIDGTGTTKEISLLAQLVLHVDEHWFVRLSPGLVAYSTSSGLASNATGYPYLTGGFGGHF